MRGQKGDRKILISFNLALSYFIEKYAFKCYSELKFTFFMPKTFNIKKYK
jgi:hypothetical protein